MLGVVYMINVVTLHMHVQRGIKQSILFVCRSVIKNIGKSLKQVILDRWLCDSYVTTSPWADCIFASDNFD